MVRVLQVLDNITAGGIQSFVMNVYRNIDRDKIQFDFLIHHTYEKSYLGEINDLGGKVYVLPSRNEGVMNNRKQLDAFFTKHKGEYDAVHLHESSLSYIEPLKYAKKHGVPIRIMHSHSTKVPSNIIHRVLHKLNKSKIGKVATDYLACGQMAAEWMYGGSNVCSKVKVVFNGINLSKFDFSEQKRAQTRERLGVSDKLVIGHVGRFEPVKNQKFLIDIISCLKDRGIDCELILAGNGRTFEDTKKYAEELVVSDCVQFLGIQSDVDSLYMAMDVMVLPSLYEGFPVTAIEAEATGVPCILADTITKEAMIKDNVCYLSLFDSINNWADEVVKPKERLTDNAVLYERGFDICFTVEQLSLLYLSAS